jgi:hypothetical protein
VFAVAIMHGELQVELAASATRLFVGANSNHLSTIRPNSFTDLGIERGAVNNHVENLLEQIDRARLRNIFLGSIGGRLGGL